jgi:FAD/FMN-containing dehydrogenase
MGLVCNGVLTMDDRKRQLAAIVGDDGVFDSPEVLESYARDQSCAPRIPPQFVVRPVGVAQVQALVQWANTTATPLIPVSSGPPHHNGDTVPSVAEAVIVDLSRMQSILKIDRRNKIVVVEPGVTWAQLEPALAAQGLRIPRPLLPRPNKSVVASLLERQPTTIPRLNYSLPEPLRVCGVVWGTGDVSFTGEAGMGPLSLEAQWNAGLAQVNQQGPLSTDLMRLLTGAQGTMGIVVWASIKCQLLPAVTKRFKVSAERLEDLIEFCRTVERLKLGDDVLAVNNVRLAEALHDAPVGLPNWSVLLGVSGAALCPREKAELQERELCAVAAQSGLTLELADERVGRVLDDFSRPAPQYDLFFLTTLDAVPEYVACVSGLADELGYGPERIGVYIQPQHQGVSQHVEFTIPYDPACAGDRAAAGRLFAKASEELAAHGAYFSRPYGPWADLVYSRDATATHVLRTVKRIVDPNRILNPGKLCF